MRTIYTVHGNRGSVIYNGPDRAEAVNLAKWEAELTGNLSTVTATTEER